MGPMTPRKPIDDGHLGLYLEETVWGFLGPPLSDSLNRKIDRALYRGAFKYAFIGFGGVIGKYRHYDA